MFKNPEELKNFIIWAKNQGIKRVKVEQIEFELSDISIVSSLSAQESQNAPKVEGNLPDLDDEELLYMSAR